MIVVIKCTTVIEPSCCGTVTGIKSTVDFQSKLYKGMDLFNNRIVEIIIIHAGIKFDFKTRTTAGGQ